MLIILMGKSAVGKDYTLKQFLNKHPSFSKLVTYTTRPPRDQEVNGVDYNFISKSDFLKKIEDDFFIEYKFYTTLVNGVQDEWCYGTGKISLDENKIVILSPSGAKVLKNWCEDNDIQCYVCYLYCDDEIRTERAKARLPFDQKEWDRRMVSDRIDFNDNNLNGLVDFTILTNSDKTVEEQLNDLLPIGETK